MRYYTGKMTEAEALRKLARAAGRLGMTPREVKVRSVAGMPGGVRLSFAWEGREVERTSVDQGSRRGNLAVLALWLVDVARNAERGIESPGEALVGERAPAVRGGGAPGGRRLLPNITATCMTTQDARARAQRTAGRIGIDPRTVCLDVHPDGTAILTFALPGGPTARKVSCLQPAGRLNAAALALWFERKALQVERGVDGVEQAFAALLPAPAPAMATAASSPVQRA